MKDWRAAVRTWERQDLKKQTSSTRDDAEARARFEAEMDVFHKQAAEKRKADKEREIEEYKQNEIRRINDMIFNNK